MNSLHQTNACVWTLAEQQEGKLKTVSFELLSWGRGLADKRGGKLSSILIGPEIDDKTLKELIRRGADEVITIQDEALRYFCCETYSAIFETLINDYKPEIILAAATSTGRTLMPYTAVKVHAGLTADCTGLDIEEGTNNLLQTRPAIGGNIMATIKTPAHRPQMATVRPRSSKPFNEDHSREGIIIRYSLKDTLPGGSGLSFLKNDRTMVRGYRRDETGFANLEEAEVIVAGGRGLKKGENFRIIQEIADDLNGEVGASRDAVDRGWISYPHQIGLSGKTVSPRLYMGVGISGAIQHLAGIKTSETIISINNDPDANLHKIADLAIVGDAFAVLAELKKRLIKRMENKNEI
ncbi:MAG: electron transfer flavoprotein subunit alpha/FixB family protein [Treponema sp.]|jgi:electron transfer flavoprotein alpha subunit|nr:electron transfer flavoprotein subunit alpha/FixB family protein [Treponema sp.]